MQSSRKEQQQWRKTDNFRDFEKPTGKEHVLWTQRHTQIHIDISVRRNSQPDYSLISR